MTAAELDSGGAFMRIAYEQAVKSYEEGGLPIGAAMVENGVVIASATTGACRMEIRSRTARWIACARPAGGGITLVSLSTPRSAHA